MSAVTDGASLSELAAQRRLGEPAAKLAVKSSSTVMPALAPRSPLQRQPRQKALTYACSWRNPPTPIVSAFVTLCRSSIANKRAFRCASPRSATKWRPCRAEGPPNLYRDQIDRKSLLAGVPESLPIARIGVVPAQSRRGWLARVGDGGAGSENADRSAGRDRAAGAPAIPARPRPASVAAAIHACRRDSRTRRPGRRRRDRRRHDSRQRCRRDGRRRRAAPRRSRRDGRKL